MYLDLWRLRSLVSYVLLASFSGPSLLTAASARLVPGQLAKFSDPAAAPQPGAVSKNPSEDSVLHIVPLEGDKAVNILKQKVTVRPVVEVRDGSNQPVKGALVTFTAPAEGPSAVFANNRRIATLVTDAAGRATPEATTAVNAGPFKYQIRAMYQEQLATATIEQTNVVSSAEGNSQDASSQATPVSTTSAPVHSHKLSGWALAAIIGGVAAGAGAGIALGTRQGSKSVAGSPTAVIGAGSGATAGAPH